MTAKKACLTNDIEKIRGELNRLVYVLDMNDPQVIKLSQELDCLICTYELGKNSND